MINCVEQIEYEREPLGVCECLGALGGPVEASEGLAHPAECVTPHTRRKLEGDQVAQKRTRRPPV